MGIKAQWFYMCYLLLLLFLTLPYLYGHVIRADGRREDWQREKEREREREKEYNNTLNIIQLY